MKRILILCTGNSCRSQMAEGYFRHFSRGMAEVYSAGIVAHGVNPLAIKVMAEEGIDLSSHSSKTISELLLLLAKRYPEEKKIEDFFDIIITVCDNARENCPVFFSSAKKIHQTFSDPAKATGNEGAVLSAFRKVRDEIKAFAGEFFKQEVAFSEKI